MADDELIKEYMHLQDALTSTHGRNRSKASIGLYGPAIMTDHEKGVEFGHIIQSHKKWPLLYDSNDEVLSLPPIINSNDLGRMTTETRNLFVEVTGTHLPTVHQALNIITASLAEREGRIESLTVVYPDESTDETPNFSPEKMTIPIDDITTMIGLDFSGDEIVKALERMGYGATARAKTVQVLVPAYRMDILHAVDVIEDIAIGYGFDRLQPAMPQTMTMGKVNPVTRLKNKVRDLMMGMGYHEIMNYIMTSPEILNEKMLRDELLVTTSNPKSRNYSVLRNSLLPVILDFAAQNQHADYPQKIFEVGDITIPDEEMETRVNQIPSVGCLMSDVKVNITAMMTEIGFLLRNLGLDERFKFVSKKSPTFIEGRSAHILVNGREVGFLGELSPEVLTNFGIAYPVVAFEIHLPRGLEW
jgi:phenylalanyl-tRNA synthetase beta chain